MLIDPNELLLSSSRVVAPRHYTRTTVLRDRLLTAILLALCFIFFFLVRRTFPYVSFPDENFDYMEQAYRLLHGYGTATWTYELGIRSWIFPGLLSAAMWLGSLFGDAATERAFAHGFMALTTLIPVWCAITWSRWMVGTGWSLLAGIFVATWFEMPYWASATLSEIFAANVFCLCIHFGFLFRLSQKSRHLAAFGVLLGFVFCIRFQFAIFLFVTAFLVCRLDWRRWLSVISWSIGVLLVSGVLDWITLGHPFQSIWLNALANSVVPISDYGMVQSPFYHLTDVELTYWSFDALLLLACATIGFNFYPGLAIIAFTIWSFHSLLSNQQTRFLYPAIMLIVVAAGIGAVSIISFSITYLPKYKALLVAFLILAIWTATSAYQAIRGPFSVNWVHRSGYLAAADYISKHAAICGLAMSDGTDAVLGSAFIGRNIPFYQSVPKKDFEYLRPYVNAVITSENYRAPGGYSKIRCWNDGYADFFGKKPNDRVCVSQRQGQCDGHAPLDRDVWPKSAIRLQPLILADLTIFKENAGS